jgi:hypothetical protein
VKWDSVKWVVGEIFVGEIYPNSNERFRKETARILEERYKHHTKIYMDGSKKEERVG